jgi:hypothetical protein
LATSKIDARVVGEHDGRYVILGIATPTHLELPPGDDICLGALLALFDNDLPRGHRDHLEDHHELTQPLPGKGAEQRNRRDERLLGRLGLLVVGSRGGMKDLCSL